MSVKAPTRRKLATPSSGKKTGSGFNTPEIFLALSDSVTLLSSGLAAGWHIVRALMRNDRVVKCVTMAVKNKERREKTRAAKI